MNPDTDDRKCSCSSPRSRLRSNIFNLLVCDRCLVKSCKDEPVRERKFSHKITYIFLFTFFFFFSLELGPRSDKGENEGNVI